jgi:DNA-binding MarR family transcriptional regulator
MNDLAIAHRLSEALFADLLGEEAVTGGQFAYMLVICENPGLSQKELSQRLQIDKGSVTRMMSRLQKKGYIDQQSSKQDKRMSLLYPTELGIKAYRHIAPIAAESERRLSNSLSSQEEEELLRLLQKVIEGLETTPKSSSTDQT